MDKKKSVSMAVIKRLPKYHRYLQELMRNDVDRISSKELGEKIGFTASQIRQDLNTCILCGEIIEQNLKYCKECSKKISITNELQNMYKNKDEEGPKMRFLNNNRKKRRNRMDISRKFL